MADIASQLVLHPTLTLALKYGGSTLGRDKAYRAIQYFARLYAWHLLNKGNKSEADRWAALKTHLGTARKLLRLGKPIEHLQATLRAALATAPVGEQLTTIARQISYFFFLSYDAIVWANSIKFIALKPETSRKVQKTSFQFWFAGILFSIINSILKTARLAKEAKRLESTKTWVEKDLADEAARETRLSAIKTSRAATRQQLLLDWLDIWIPATGAGLVNVNEGALGILGLITSLVGVKAQWNVIAKR
ncbi:peroxisomal biogenesis factor 11 [Amanita rubescens]|nr:peroxisomal biogenesis factor 11 [Amanita rubescens]